MIKHVSILFYIKHISRYSFSKNNEKTITAIDPSICNIRRNGLSTQDALCLNILYPRGPPTLRPTRIPTALPTLIPTELPTVSPTITTSPTSSPTASPTITIAKIDKQNQNKSGFIGVIVFAIIFMVISCLTFVVYSTLSSKKNSTETNETNETKITQEKVMSLIIDSNPSKEAIGGTDDKQTNSQMPNNTEITTVYSDDGTADNTSSKVTNKPMGLPKPIYDDIDTTSSIHTYMNLCNNK